MKKKLLHVAMIRYLAVIICFLAVNLTYGQEDEAKKSMEIYGFIMTDIGYNFNQIQPDWYDAVRPTKLPSYKDEYGVDGSYYASVRQTRFGIKNYFDTGVGELKTTFEFELYGTGVDAGQTTFRLRHAYAELGKFGAGQTWSPFMDIDVFPNTLEYWGPTGMVFFRNVQIRYMPIQGDTRLTIALERPGASADQGMYANRIELQGVNARFPLPDLSAEYHHGFNWGYLELAGILRKIEWKDQNNDQFDLSGDALGWGLNLSTNIKFGQSTVFKGQVVYGEGIQNYMNDAPVDIGIETNPGNPTEPVKGVALPLVGVVAFIDHSWSEKFTSSLGYSMIDIDNANGQTPDAFKKGQYVVGNILYSPAKNCLVGAEFQWGDRENFSDGWSTSINKVQLSFKYNFSQAFYRKN
ncbi:DcaP family trimeric outer membrane transporter [Flavobacterium sp. LC2016-12]|uniref:DcaP family trimeric outer membrane transporter n=1 Tax=Flavobacterium sp. LC2016-12 TaxID=2783794 RepID=UPI001E45B7AC|nr:DcaP family trimeric outer membrane transporter [Flavobacterium sp. LC2016-12]